MQPQREALPENAARPPRFLTDIRWIAGGVATVAVLTLLWQLLGPEPRLIVSPRTTSITAPLSGDGLPDYIAHVAGLSGPAPPPEENAAVPLLHTLWPLAMTPGGKEIAAVCKALGISATRPAEPPLVDADHDPAVKAAVTATDVLWEKPWRGDDLPAAAAWLERNTAAIDRLLEASGRPRYWFVSPTLLEPKDAMLIGVLLPDVTAFRRAARALAIRGMWHLGSGRTREAWADILAIHRLSRLQASAQQPSFLIRKLVAVAVGRIANTATRQLLAAPHLAAAERETIRRDLAALPDLCTDVSPCVEFERLMSNDAVVAMAARRHGIGRRQLLSGIFGVAPPPPGVEQLIFLTSIDWNVILRRMNESYDALDAATRLPTPGERDVAIKKAETHLQRLSAGQPLWRQVGSGLAFLTSRDARSEDMARMLAGLLMPALSHAFATVDGFHDDFRKLLEEAATAGP